MSGNADTHLIFKTGAGAWEAFNGLQMPFVGESVNTTSLFIVDFNSTSSKTWINNANEQSGSTGTTSSTKIALFGSVTGTTLSNAVMRTLIQASAINNSTQRSTMYNVLKSMNNNAF
jgi:hypothetical protein